VIIDEMFSQSRQGCYRLTRVHHVDGHTIQIRVYRDFYGSQSHAVAEVLTTDRTWTTVADTPWTQWHGSTPQFAADPTILIPVADSLLKRARRILTPPDATTQQ
jgi:hypothetical protein